MGEQNKKDPKNDSEEEEDPDLEEEEDDDDDDDEEDPPKVVKIRQDKLDKQLARSHNKGERSGRKAILKELGFETLEEAKSKISAKDKEDEGKSQEEKEQAQKEKREADEAKRDAAKTKAEAKIEKILLRKKVKDKRLDRAVKLIDPEEHLESDEEDILEAVESLMEDMPEMFRGEDDEEDDDTKSKKRPPRKSSPGGPPRKKGAPTTTNKVQERLAKRHPKKAKSTN